MKALKKISGFVDKVPRWAAVIIVIAAAAFGSAHSTQSFTILLPQMMASYGLAGAAEIPAVLGWIMGSLGAWITFEVVMLVFLTMMRTYAPMMDRRAAAHYGRMVFAGAYLIIGLVGIMYFFFPLGITMGHTVIEFVIMAAFGFLFYLLISRRFVPSFLWGRLLFQMGIIFLIYHGVTAAYAIIGSVGVSA